MIFYNWPGMLATLAALAVSIVAMRGLALSRDGVFLHAACLTALLASSFASLYDRTDGRGLPGYYNDVLRRFLAALSPHLPESRGWSLHPKGRMAYAGAPLVLLPWVVVVMLGGAVIVRSVRGEPDAFPHPGDALYAVAYAALATLFTSLTGRTRALPTVAAGS